MARAGHQSGHTERHQYRRDAVDRKQRAVTQAAETEPLRREDDQHGVAGFADKGEQGDAEGQRAEHLVAPDVSQAHGDGRQEAGLVSAGGPVIISSRAVLTGHEDEQGGSGHERHTDAEQGQRTVDLEEERPEGRTDEEVAHRLGRGEAGIRGLER